MLRQPLVHMMVASVGPICSEALRDHRVHVDMEPSHPKMGVLVKEAAEQSAGFLAALDGARRLRSTRTGLP